MTKKNLLVVSHLSVKSNITPIKQSQSKQTTYAILSSRRKSMIKSLHEKSGLDAKGIAFRLALQLDMVKDYIADKKLIQGGMPRGTCPVTGMPEEFLRDLITCLQNFYVPVLPATITSPLMIVGGRHKTVEEAIKMANLKIKEAFDYPNPRRPLFQNPLEPKVLSAAAIDIQKTKILEALKESDDSAPAHEVLSCPKATKIRPIKITIPAGFGKKKTSVVK